MPWVIHRGTEPPDDAWKPFAVDQGEILWRRWDGPKPRESAPSFVGIEKVAEMLAVDVATVRRWIGEGELPKPLRLGRTLRWPLEDLLGELRKRREQAPM